MGTTMTNRDRNEIETAFELIEGMLSRRVRVWRSVQRQKHPQPGWLVRCRVEVDPMMNESDSPSWHGAAVSFVLSDAELSGDRSRFAVLSRLSNQIASAADVLGAVAMEVDQAIQGENRRIAEETDTQGHKKAMAEKRKHLCGCGTTALPPPGRARIEAAGRIT